MCGIFGVIVNKTSDYKPQFIKNTLENLAALSESRGKDSSGLCFRNDKKNQFDILKTTGPITNLLNKKEYKILLSENLGIYNNNISNFTSFGHSRLVTNGSQLKEYNNQPVIKDGLIVIHNGIITNVRDLWIKNTQLKREFDLDTEIMLAMMRENLKSGDSVHKSINKIISSIEGTVSTAMFFDDRDEVLLSTNNGSLYFATNYKDFLIFASEGYILEKLIKDLNIESIVDNLTVKHLKANTAVQINVTDFKLNYIKITKEIFDDSEILESKEEIKKYKISCKSLKGDNNKPMIVDESKFTLDFQNPNKRKLLEYNIDRIKMMKRCTKCLLPYTFPFIKFDDRGVCNYCNNYIQKNQPKPIKDLLELVEPFRSKDGSPDVLVPFSGGRDSTYVLHFVKKELGLNPIAYTYDWGMVTDLGRRNIARVCGKLGVENIIVAADIKMKRRNIKLNIEAWLKKPELGMIPIFMAGDKQFFKYANVVKKQQKIDLNIWGINFLENTDFKVGFCGVPPEWDKEMIYSMNVRRKIKLFKYVGKNILTNPSYLNISLFDTFDSFLSRYKNPRKDYYHFFDFFEWNENEIDRILKEEYAWETAKDLKSTWRIGDGTASFYNYIYYTVAGFSEFDTFRSNQIREGMITREEALDLVNDENIPRYDSLRWYLEIIGLDYEKTIKKINKISKLYM